MSNHNRYAKNETNLLRVPVASATVIDVGDLCLLTSGKALRMITSTSASTFLGVAQLATIAGEDHDITVAQDGVFRYPSTATTWVVGNYAGRAGNQEVEQLSTATHSIGRCEEAGTTISSVLVRIKGYLR